MLRADDLVASHADVLSGSSRVSSPRDELLRTSAWEANDLAVK